MERLARSRRRGHMTPDFLTIGQSKNHQILTYREQFLNFNLVEKCQYKNREEGSADSEYNDL